MPGFFVRQLHCRDMPGVAVIAIFSAALRACNGGGWEGGFGCKRKRRAYGYRSSAFGWAKETGGSMLLRMYNASASIRSEALAWRNMLETLLLLPACTHLLYLHGAAGLLPASFHLRHCLCTSWLPPVLLPSPPLNYLTAGVGDGDASMPRHSVVLFPSPVFADGIPSYAAFHKGRRGGTAGGAPPGSEHGRRAAFPILWHRRRLAAYLATAAVFCSLRNGSVAAVRRPVPLAPPFALPTCLPFLNCGSTF